VRTLIPTTEAETVAEVLAPRARALAGAVVGLYANVKGNADKFLDAVAELIVSKYPIERIYRRTEGEAGFGSEGPYDELAARCHIVLAGVGD
jgi:hypothetical protein